MRGGRVVGRGLRLVLDFTAYRGPGRHRQTGGYQRQAPRLRAGRFISSHFTQILVCTDIHASRITEFDPVEAE